MYIVTLKFFVFIHVLVSCLFYGASFCFVETILALRLTFAFFAGALFEKKRTETTKKLQTLHSKLSTFQPVPWFLL